MAAPNQPVMHTTFKEIKIHTAKCDECNYHNSSTIYRCIDCSQQCCTPCWNKKGGDGTHLINSGSMSAQKPIIVKAEDVEKSKLRKKKNVGEGRKRRVKKTVQAMEKDVDENNEGGDDIENGSAEDALTDHNVMQAGRKTLKIDSKGAIMDDDETNDDDAMVYPTSMSKQTVKADNNSVKNTRTVKGSHDDPMDVPSNAISLGNKNKSKRKHTAISDNEAITGRHSEYAWAYQHAAKEGKKRVRTTSDAPSTMTDSTLSGPASTENEADETVEYAKYLLDLSRGSLADTSSSPSHNEESHEVKTPRNAAAHTVTPHPPSLDSQRLSSIGTQNLNTEDQEVNQPQPKNRPVTITDNDKMDTQHPTLPSQGLLSGRKKLSLDNFCKPGPNENVGPRPRLMKRKQSMSKQSREEAIDRSLQVPSASDATGTAKTGGIYLEANNNIRVRKPSIARQDAPNAAMPDEEDFQDKHKLFIDPLSSNTFGGIHSNSHTEHPKRVRSNALLPGFQFQYPPPKQAVKTSTPDQAGISDSPSPTKTVATSKTKGPGSLTKADGPSGKSPKRIARAADFF